MENEQIEPIIGHIIKREETFLQYFISYEIGGQEYTVNFLDLFDLTNTSGPNCCYQNYQNNIHFFDASNSDLNHIMGICSILYYEKPCLSEHCSTFDPCLYMSYTINDNWGLYPELQSYDTFKQCRYILKLLIDMGYARKYELFIKDFKEHWEQELKEEYSFEENLIWPSYTQREPGTIGLLCVDQAFKKDNLLLQKIDCYFETLKNDQEYFEALNNDRDISKINPDAQTIFYDKDGYKETKFYFLQDNSDHPYISTVPGQFGGHHKLKIYGRLDCPSAARYIKKGQYVRHRVFFADQQAAINAGYRPCGICMKEEYKRWAEAQNAEKNSRI